MHCKFYKTSKKQSKKPEHLIMQVIRIATWILKDFLYWINITDSEVTTTTTNL